MRNKAKISLIVGLVWIFSFPIVFQSLHNISKHLHDADVCCNTSGNDVHIESDTFKCPILAYESAVMDLPEKALFIEALLACNFIVFNYYENPIIAFSSSQIQLRAPPKISLYI